MMMEPNIPSQKPVDYNSTNEMSQKTAASTENSKNPLPSLDRFFHNTGQLQGTTEDRLHSKTPSTHGSFPYPLKDPSKYENDMMQKEAVQPAKSGFLDHINSLQYDNTVPQLNMYPNPPENKSQQSHIHAPNNQIFPTGYPSNLQSHMFDSISQNISSQVNPGLVPNTQYTDPKQTVQAPADSTTKPRKQRKKKKEKTDKSLQKTCSEQSFDQNFTSNFGPGFNGNNYSSQSLNKDEAPGLQNQLYSSLSNAMSQQRSSSGLQSSQSFNMTNQQQQFSGTVAGSPEQSYNPTVPSSQHRYDTTIQDSSRFRAQQQPYSSSVLPSYSASIPSNSQPPEEKDLSSLQAQVTSSSSQVPPPDKTQERILVPPPDKPQERIVYDRPSTDVGVNEDKIALLDQLLSPFTKKSDKNNEAPKTTTKKKSFKTKAHMEHMIDMLEQQKTADVDYPKDDNASKLLDFLLR